jgi:hypothetical protein
MSFEPTKISGRMTATAARIAGRSGSPRPSFGGREQMPRWAIPGGGDIVRNMDVMPDGIPAVADGLTNQGWWRSNGESR